MSPASEKPHCGSRVRLLIGLGEVQAGDVGRVTHVEDGFMEVEFVNPDTQFLQLNEFSLSGDDDYMFELLPEEVAPKVEKIEPTKAEPRESAKPPEPKLEPTPKAASKVAVAQTTQAAHAKDVAPDPKAAPKGRNRGNPSEKAAPKFEKQESLRLSARMARNASILLESARDGSPFLRERALIQLREHGYFEYAEIRDKIQEFARDAQDREWKRYYREWLEKS